MGRLLVIIRSITLAGFMAFICVFFGFGIHGSDNIAIRSLALVSLLYLLLELISIIYRLIYYHSIDDSTKQLKFVTFSLNGQIDIKTTSFFRRVSFAGLVAAIICVILKKVDLSTLVQFDFLISGISYLFVAILRWAWVAFIITVLMTFVKAWYIMHTKWEGAYSVPVLVGKIVGADFTQWKKARVIEAIVVVVIMALGILLI